MGKATQTPASLAINLPLSQGDPPREFGVGDLHFAWLTRPWTYVNSVIGCHCRRNIPVRDLIRDILKCNAMIGSTATPSSLRTGLILLSYTVRLISCTPSDSTSELHVESRAPRSAQLQTSQSLNIDPHDDCTINALFSLFSITRSHTPQFDRMQTSDSLAAMPRIVTQGLKTRA
jgi:hypothetical protein